MITAMAVAGLVLCVVLAIVVAWYKDMSVAELVVRLGLGIVGSGISIKWAILGFGYRLLDWLKLNLYLGMASQRGECSFNEKKE